MTYRKSKYIEEAISQKIKKKDVYQTDTHKIYNLIVGQINKRLQEKAELDATWKEVKTGRDPIGYPMISKKLYFSNQC